MHIKTAQIINMQYNLSEDGKDSMTWQSQCIFFENRILNMYKALKEVGREVLLFVGILLSVHFHVYPHLIY